MATATLTFAVTGMTCQHCVASVTREVSEVAGVNKVSVERKKAGLTVHLLAPPRAPQNLTKRLPKPQVWLGV
jgi:copper chaperone CopZ